ncbi:hypothetical protein [Chthoniobacter flavus]|nr:hypothetical protein [Chthoniobacter flavus]
MPDDELDSRFTRQRKVDRQNAPSFHAMRTRSLETPPGGQSERSTLWWGWVSGSVVALALAIAAWQHTHPHPAPRQRQPELLAQQLDAIDAALQKTMAAQHDLSAWQSPTDFLIPPIQHLDQP